MDGGICRVKLAGGSITAHQAQAVADVARQYASGVIEATNRANLQIRGVGTQHSALIAPLLAAGLGPNTAASDEVRNLMLSPTAGIDPAMALDTWPLAQEVLASLEATPRLSELSAKFAVQLDGGEALAMLEHPHDLWLSAFEHDGQVLLGFGLAGCPAHDAALAAVPVAQGHELVMAVLNLFLDMARPEHTRMRHLLKEVPVAQFVQQLAERLSAAPVQLAAWRRHTLETPLHIGTYPQRETGRVYVGAAPPLGRLDAKMLSGLAQIASDYGDGTLRFTPWQSVLLPNLRAELAPEVTRQLVALGLLCEVTDPLSHLVACTGSSACAKGLADTKQDARQLATLLSQPLNIHLSGCPRSCAAAHIAPVTLLAVAPGHYDLYLRAPEHAGFGVLRERNLTIEAAGAWLEARQRSNTDD
ncbi:precorrin-3B synthase [Pseudomonas weihenstephanensis]|uniref:precorrin-3B synthase n=1 Tax=Pseudomonas weihenstephanensis TaxID=1608994 RepID=UPI00193BB412|nr:precorrin-3B synthase [Pseudomonas weihenstephanensis]